MDVDVLVVGPVSKDVMVPAERLLDPGETLLASELVTSCGGKETNQTVATARGEVRVAMAGAVGDDETGHRQAETLEMAGVDIRWLRRLTDVPTGTAFIQVGARGENIIVVAQGANTRVALPAGNIEARVIVTQDEIPLAVQQVAGEFAARTGARLVVNAAPAPEGPPFWYGSAGPLVVNEREAAQLAASNEAGAELLHQLRERAGARSLVMTLGVRRALVDGGTGVHAIPPVVVEWVVDATGAGDTFVGVLAAQLALDEGLVAAAPAVNRSAVEAIIWPEARPPAE